MTKRFINRFGKLSLIQIIAVGFPILILNLFTTRLTFEFIILVKNRFFDTPFSFSTTGLYKEFCHFMTLFRLDLFALTSLVLSFIGFYYGFIRYVLWQEMKPYYYYLRVFFFGFYVPLLFFVVLLKISTVIFHSRLFQGAEWFSEILILVVLLILFLVTFFYIRKLLQKGYPLFVSAGLSEWRILW